MVQAPKPINFASAIGSPYKPESSNEKVTMFTFGSNHRNQEWLLANLRRGTMDQNAWVLVSLLPRITKATFRAFFLPFNPKTEDEMVRQLQTIIAAARGGSMATCAVPQVGLTEYDNTMFSLSAFGHDGIREHFLNETSLLED